MHAIVQWLAKLNIKRNMMSVFVNKKHRYKRILLILKQVVFWLIKLMANYARKEVRIAELIFDYFTSFHETLIFSMYTLGDLGVLSNLIGSLSLANEHYSPPTEWIMRKPNKNKMAGVNTWIERSIKSIFNGFLLKMLLRSLPVYILKQLFYSISVNSGRIFTSISKNNC